MFRVANTRGRISVVTCIVSGVGNYVGNEVGSFNIVSVGIEDGGEVFSRDVISVGKYAKGGLNGIIDDSVTWGIGRLVGDIVFIGVDGELNMSKVELVWKLMTM